MSVYYTEKALQATKNKIDRNIRQSRYFIRNLWQVIGFGILVSIWAPFNTDSSGKSVLEVSELSYYEFMMATALVYTFFCFLAHFIWGNQDKKQLQQLLERKKQLEDQLGIKQ